MKRVFSGLLPLDLLPGLTFSSLSSARDHAPTLFQNQTVSAPQLHASTVMRGLTFTGLREGETIYSIKVATLPHRGALHLLLVARNMEI
jgi:hypothetical protein